MMLMVQKVRQAAVAGQFYPAAADSLRQEVADCYRRSADSAAAVRTAAAQGKIVVRAVVVPHAGYVFSGAVAATAFSSIPAEARYDHIFLLGPSHHVAFDGASVCNAFDAYQTPLGPVAVDRALCDRLIHDNDHLVYLPSAHDREHCLEVQLPFLQQHLHHLPPIVPIILGTQHLDRLKEIADALRPYFTDRNLFVISSDFCHYPDYADALTVDGNSGEALESGRLDKFIAALQKNESMRIHNLYTSACGQSAIAVLLLLAADSTGALAAPFAMHHLTYCNSGDSPYGGKDQVVGYHAFALTATVSSQHDGRGSSQSADKDKDQEDFLSAADKEQLLNVAWNAIAPARLHRVVTPTAVFARKLGVFVTLTEGGRLRGCIGHFGEDIPLGDITQEMAHAAAFEDPRFPSLSEDELDGIDIEISVLTPLQRIHDVKEFHYGRQGIYMRKGWRSGTFLPQVAEEVNWTKEEFLGHCAQDKAGIGWDGWKTAELYTYEAVRFHKKL